MSIAGIEIGGGITIGQGINLGATPPASVTANGTTFSPGNTITWTIHYYTPNTKLYFWIDGNAYAYSNFTVAPVDGTTSVTTDSSGSATFSLTLKSSATSYPYWTAYFAPTLYQGNVNGLHTSSVTIL